MKNINPIYIFCDDKIDYDTMITVRAAINELLLYAGVTKLPRVVNSGKWRTNPLYIDDILKKYANPMWYICEARRSSRFIGVLDARTLLDLFETEPLHYMYPHYKVFVTSRPLYIEKTKVYYLRGIAASGSSAIISTYYFQNLEKKARQKCIRGLTLHEVGHMFGLLPRFRPVDRKFSGGSHCVNICIMRQGCSVKDYEFILRPQGDGTPFCLVCLENLKMIFKKLGYS